MREASLTEVIDELNDGNEDRVKDSKELLTSVDGLNTVFGDMADHVKDIHKEIVGDILAKRESERESKRTKSISGAGDGGMTDGIFSGGLGSLASGFVEGFGQLGTRLFTAFAGIGLMSSSKFRGLVGKFAGSFGMWGKLAAVGIGIFLSKSILDEFKSGDDEPSETDLVEQAKIDAMTLSEKLSLANIGATFSRLWGEYSESLMTGLFGASILGMFGGAAMFSPIGLVAAVAIGAAWYFKDDIMDALVQSDEEKQKLASLMQKAHSQIKSKAQNFLIGLNEVYGTDLTFDDISNVSNLSNLGLAAKGVPEEVLMTLLEISKSIEASKIGDGSGNYDWTDWSPSGIWESIKLDLLGIESFWEKFTLSVKASQNRQTATDKDAGFLDWDTQEERDAADEVWRQEQLRIQQIKLNPDLTGILDIDNMGGQKQITVIKGAVNTNSNNTQTTINNYGNNGPTEMLDEVWINYNNNGKN